MQVFEQVSRFCQSEVLQCGVTHDAIKMGSWKLNRSHVGCQDIDVVPAFGRGLQQFLLAIKKKKVTKTKERVMRLRSA